VSGGQDVVSPRARSQGAAQGALGAAPLSYSAITCDPEKIYTAVLVGLVQFGKHFFTRNPFPSYTYAPVPSDPLAVSSRFSAS
jgi:hypothetical protein